MPSLKDRKPVERERDNIANGDAARAPKKPGQTDSKSSYGPFGRGDREPKAGGKAPRK
jgi:hypothetical protein